MEYRFLGRTGVRISRLCMGTMSFGGDADEAMAAKMLARARDAGINTFDSADVYNGGRSEEILGRFLKGSREDVVLATKAYFPTSDDPNARGSSRLHLLRAVEASLRRLDTDRIDLLYLHRYDDVTALEETLRAVEQLVTAGKILYPAVSNFTAWQTARALGVAETHDWQPIVCTQPMYNLLKRQAEVEILPLAQADGLGVMTYSPVAGGLLNGRYGVAKRPARGRILDNLMYATRYAAAYNFEVAEAFTTLAAELGHHPVSLAIAWAGAHPAVTAPIVGARNLEQLEICLGATSIQLDAPTYARIAALSPTPAPATDRNEESSEHNFGAR